MIKHKGDIENKRDRRSYSIKDIANITHRE